jgi:NADP-reducing hydrogenase subunit HndB
MEIIITMGSCGIAAGAENTRQAFLDLIEEQGFPGVTVKVTSCKGRCSHEPIVQVLRGEQSGVFYGKVDPSAAAKIMKQHIRDGQPVKEYIVPV